MKITAYEVREYETEIMKKLADKLGIDELVTTAEPLTLDTAHLAKGAAVIKNLSGFGCKILAHSRHEDENVKKYATIAKKIAVRRLINALLVKTKRFSS